MKLNRNFSERVALITGAGSSEGIGFATARQLALQGAKIAITSTTERIEERARELAAAGAEVFALPADLRDHAQTQRLVREVLARYGHLDILETTSLPLAELSDEEWDYSMALNLKRRGSHADKLSPAETRVLVRAVSQRRLIGERLNGIIIIESHTESLL